MECFFIGRVFRYFGGSMFGVFIKYCICLNKFNVFMVYVWLLDVMVYFDMVMVVNDFEKI